jgi:hypothetical protein
MVFDIGSADHLSDGDDRRVPDGTTTTMMQPSGDFKLTLDQKRLRVAG